MEQFKIYQQALEETYPSLTVFSDLNWNDLFQEYIVSYDQFPHELNDFIFDFPQFLQNKAQEGDCPVYLFELAYYELAQSQILKGQLDLPEAPGLYLNPSATFLNLEFDVRLMMGEASKGSIQVLERSHLLCLYRHPLDGFRELELDHESLVILTELENGPIAGHKVKETFQDMIKLGLILER